MLQHYCDALRRLRRDERGNIFILFAATGLPLLMFMGGAVDVARFARYRADLANAVNSAALALARQHGDYSDPEATEFVDQTTSKSFGSVEDSSVHGADLRASTRLDHGWRVTANGTMKTMFLPIAKLAQHQRNLDVMKADVLAEVLSSTNRLELALVFDNTGSMNCGNVETFGCAEQLEQPGGRQPHRGAEGCRAHAHQYADADDGGNPDIKIGARAFRRRRQCRSRASSMPAYAGHPPAWLDWSDQAKAKYNGQNFGKYDFVADTAVHDRQQLQVRRPQMALRQADGQRSEREVGGLRGDAGGALRPDRIRRRPRLCPTRCSCRESGRTSPTAATTTATAIRTTI